MYTVMFYTISLLLLVLNIMDAFGWVLIPTQAILYPSIVMTTVWVCIIVIATNAVINNMKNKK